METTNMTLQTTKITPQNAAQNLDIPESFVNNLSPEQQRQIASIAANIDITDRNAVSAFGYEQQTVLGKCADTMIQGVGSSALGETGDLLNNAMAEIRGYQEKCNDEKQGKGFFAKLLGNPKKYIMKMKDSYAPVNQKLQIISKELVDKKLSIERVFQQFETLFQENKATYEYLSMMICAGEDALVRAKAKLQEMQANPATDPQELRDYNDQIVDFDKRIYDLKTTRTVALTLAPQIRSVQKSANNVAKAIDTALHTTIPMWKTEVAMALGIQEVQTGLHIANSVTDFNNQMLEKISEAGKELAIESAKANARGVVDIDTLRRVNQNTIDALTESTRITREAIDERQRNSQELKEIERNLVNAVKTIV